MNKVLVTGAAGFIGRHTLPLLKEKGYEVHALSRVSRQEKGIFWHQIDLLDRPAIDALLESVVPTHLLHFAWITAHGKYWNSTENLNWVEASLHLARAFARIGGKRMVVAGTCAEYAEGGVCNENTSAFGSATLYGTCKRALYLMLNAFAKEVGLEFAWGYLFHLYGPGEFENRFVPAVIRALLEKRDVPLSHGNQKRDFLHAADAAEGFVELLHSKALGSFNIASGQSLSLRELAEKLAEKIGGAHHLQFGALSSSDLPELVADVQKFQKQVNWQPKYSLEAGLEEVIAWWR